MYTGNFSASVTKGSTSKHERHVWIPVAAQLHKKTNAVKHGTRPLPSHLDVSLTTASISPPSSGAPPYFRCSKKQQWPLLM